MNDSWKDLQRRNARDNEIREIEGRDVIHAFLGFAPAIPAIFIIGFSDSSHVDVVAGIAILDSVRETTGPSFVSYAVVFTYLALIWFLKLGFYRDLTAKVQIVIAWLAWAWFYFCVLYLHDLRLAFVMLFVCSLFMIKIVGLLTGCYELIRERMFLGGGKGR